MCRIVKAIIAGFNVTKEQAMEILKIPAEDNRIFSDLIK